MGLSDLMGGKGSGFNPLKRVATGVNKFASGLGGMMQGSGMDFRPTNTGQMETGNDPNSFASMAPGQSAEDFIRQRFAALFPGQGMPAQGAGQAPGSPPRIVSRERPDFAPPAQRPPVTPFMQPQQNNLPRGGRGIEEFAQRFKYFGR